MPIPPTALYFWSMIFSENRYPLFGIMLSLGGGQRRRPSRGGRRHGGALEIAAPPRQALGGSIAKLRAVARDRAREDVIDHHGRDGGGKPESGGQQRLGNARRDHCEIGGLRLRDADEAVHDAPDGPEQSDEGRGRADGGEHAGAAQNAPPVARLDALEARRDALLDAFSFRRAGRQLELDHGGVEKFP